MTNPVGISVHNAKITSKGGKKVGITVNNYQSQTYVGLNFSIRLRWPHVLSSLRIWSCVVLMIFIYNIIYVNTGETDWY